MGVVLLQGGSLGRVVCSLVKLATLADVIVGGLIVVLVWHGDIVVHGVDVWVEIQLFQHFAFAHGVVPAKVVVRCC